MVTTACTTVNGTPASAATSPCTSSPSTSTIYVPATIACGVFTTTTAISIGPSAGTSAPSSTTALHCHIWNSYSFNNRSADILVTYI